MSKRSKMETDSIDISIEKRSKKLSWSEKCVELVKSLNEGESPNVCFFYFKRKL